MNNSFSGKKLYLSSNDIFPLALEDFNPSGFLGSPTGQACSDRQQMAGEGQEGRTRLLSLRQNSGRQVAGTYEPPSPLLQPKPESGCSAPKNWSGHAWLLRRQGQRTLLHPQHSGRGFPPLSGVGKATNDAITSGPSKP